MAGLIVLALTVSATSAGTPPDPAAWEQIRRQHRTDEAGRFLQRLRRLPNSGVRAQVTAVGVSTPTIGTNMLPVLLIDFSDSAGQKTDNDFESMLFGSGNTSMADYYSEVSYGQFTVSGAAFPDTGWYRASGALSDYVNSYGGVLDAYPNNAQGLVEEVVLAADADVDFSQFDNDGDGFVDTVIVVFAGYSASADADYQHKLWPHQWRLSGGQNGPGPVSVDGVKVNTYLIANELSGSSGSILAKIGTYCHEYGHALGLPDLYSTDFEGNYDSQWGLGTFALMAYGGKGGDRFSAFSPTHMCPWSKIQLGWVTPTQVTTTLTGEVIQEAESVADVYRLWASGSSSTEYFLTEYRHRTGFDQRLPGCGLLVYHIDEQVLNQDVDGDGILNQFDNAVQWDETHKFIDVEAANQTGSDHALNTDVLDDRSANPASPLDTGGGGVFFNADSGRTTFDGAGMPSTVGYGGSATGVSITNVSSCAGDPVSITADLAVGTLPAPDDNLWINDCSTETGGEPSNPPCNAWWTSTDIFLDSDRDGLQDEPVYDEPNRLFVQVQNLGTTPALNVTVDVYFTNNSTGLNFPGTATLIDSSSIPLITPGQQVQTSVIWNIPAPPGNGHYCIGAVATTSSDAQSSQVINLDNNLGAVNLVQLFNRAGDGTPGGAGAGLDPGGPLVADFDAENPGIDPLDVRLSAEVNLPAGWTAEFEDLTNGIIWSGSPGPPLVPRLLPGEKRPMQMRLTQPATVFHGQTGTVRVMQHVAATFPAPAGVMGGIDFQILVDGRNPRSVSDLRATIALNTPVDVAPAPGSATVRLDFTPVSVDLFGDPERVSHYNVYRGNTSPVATTPANFVGKVLGDAKPNQTGWQFYDATAPLISMDPVGTVLYYAVTVVDDAGFESDPSNTALARAEAIPAVSTWGLLLLTAGFATAGTLVIRRRSNPTNA